MLLLFSLRAVEEGTALRLPEMVAAREGKKRLAAEVPVGAALVAIPVEAIQVAIPTEATLVEAIQEGS